MEKRFLNIREASAYLGFAVPTLYAYCSARSIPVIRKNRRLRFDVLELDAWMREDFVAAAEATG